MAQNKDNVLVTRPVVAGAVSVAAKDADMPTALEKLGAGFESLGWLSEDGITMTINKETTELPGFGGDVIKTIQSKHAVSFKFKPMETNAAVMKAMFGDSNVVDSSGKVTKVTVNSDEVEERRMVIDVRTSANEICRVMIPHAKVTEIGEIPIKHNEAMASEWTVAAEPDESGNKAYIHYGVAASE